MTIFLALLHFSTSTVCSLNWCLQQMRAISPAHCSTLHQQHGQRCSVMTTSYILKQTIYLCIWLENIYFRNPISGWQSAHFTSLEPVVNWRNTTLSVYCLSTYSMKRFTSFFGSGCWLSPVSPASSSSTGELQAEVP